MSALQNPLDASRVRDLHPICTIFKSDSKQLTAAAAEGMWRLLDWGWLDQWGARFLGQYKQSLPQYSLRWIHYAVRTPNAGPK